MDAGFLQCSVLRGYVYLTYLLNGFLYLSYRTVPSVLGPYCILYVCTTYCTTVCVVEFAFFFLFFSLPTLLAASVVSRLDTIEGTNGKSTHCLLAALSPSCLSHSIELAMVTPSFLGGALSFKGDKKTKAKKKRRKAKYHIDEEKKKERIKPQSVPDDDYDDELTEAERKALKYKLEKERNDLERVAAKSHRERVEEFNEKLGKLTEHNDIPRVSQEKGMATSTSNDFVGILIIRLFVYLFYRSALLEMVRASMGQIQGTARCRLMICYGILIHVNEHYNRNEPHK